MKRYAVFISLCLVLGISALLSGRIFSSTAVTIEDQQFGRERESENNFGVSDCSPLIDTPFATPHNIALTPGRGFFFTKDHGAGRKLYLTHSGATANKVTVYKLKNNIPEFHREITVGFNPFGLAFVP